MITESILNIFVNFVEWLIDLLPKVDYSIPASVFDMADMVFGNIGYVLPMAGLIPLFIFMVALDNFKLIMAIIVRIKSFIPTMGA